jgi:hypothetical protein
MHGQYGYGIMIRSLAQLCAEVMRPKLLIFAAALAAALIGPSLSLAQSADQAAPPSTTPANPTQAAGQHTTGVSELIVAARRSTAVSELDVKAPVCPKIHKATDEPPKLVSTYPARGATIRPGVMILRLTFDKPMTCQGLLGIDGARANPCPAPLEEPLYSRDRHTFLTVCRIDGNGNYGLELKGFTSVTGQVAEPDELAFQTSDDEPVASIDDALARDAYLKTGGKAKK